MGSFWDRFGIVLGSFWGRFGVILEPFWDRFGIVLGSFRDRFGTVSGSFWGHVGVNPVTQKVIISAVNPVTAITKIIRKTICSAQ